MDFGIIVDYILDDFLKQFQKVLNSWKVLFSQGETMIFKVWWYHLFMLFRPFSDTVFFIDLVDFWDPSGSIFTPFPYLFTSSSATFWHLDFTLIFQWLLNGFWHHCWWYVGWLFEEITERVKFMKSIVLPRKNKVFQGSAASFFHVFSIHVWFFSGSKFISISSWFWEPFGLHFRPLYDPLGIVLDICSG